MTKKTNGGKMRELTAEKIQENYDSLLNTIQLHITGDRKEKVLKMHNDMKDRFMMAPASAKEHYHNAMYGGYVDHILRVVDLSLKVKELWEQNGCKIDFTDEELNKILIREKRMELYKESLKFLKASILGP